MFIETQNNIGDQGSREERQNSPQSTDGYSHTGKTISVKKEKKWGRVFFGFVFLAGAVYGGYWWYQNPGSTSFSLYEEKYHGVFMDNGDIYFGKLSNKESAFVMLDDVYYLRVTQVSQNVAGSKVSIPDLKLIRVGAEFHKPKGSIELQKNHILFIQELAPDSSVISAIKGDQALLQSQGGAAQ